MKSIYFMLFTCLIVAVDNNASAKGKKKNPKANFKMLEAYTQKTIPGIRGAQPTIQTNFIVIWENAKNPETFFWRGENGWQNCRMMKAHYIGNQIKKMPSVPDYRSEFVIADKIHNGDTLILTPVAGGKFPIPTEIPADAKNTLFYKTGGSIWLSFPVKEIGKKPDILLQ